MSTPRRPTSVWGQGSSVCLHPQSPLVRFRLRKRWILRRHRRRRAVGHWSPRRSGSDGRRRQRERPVCRSFCKDLHRPGLRPHTSLGRPGATAAWEIHQRKVGASRVVAVNTVAKTHARPFKRGARARVAGVAGRGGSPEVRSGRPGGP